MKVYIPSPLRSYTGGKGEVSLDGLTVAEVLADLDRRYPGSRFRIISEQGHPREHVRLFVNGELVGDLGMPVCPDDEVHIICALSGGL